MTEQEKHTVLEVLQDHFAGEYTILSAEELQTLRVIYEIEDRQVLILAVMHPKRHEGRWKRRIRKQREGRNKSS